MARHAEDESKPLTQILDRRGKKKEAKGFPVNGEKKKGNGQEKQNA